jgi:hypothetical protein
MAEGATLLVTTPLMTTPLVVAGMHRSGTSLTAAMIEALGVDMGPNLLAADRHNATGYFEDVDFLAFQRSLLQAACVPEEPGWPDWGWTESERLDAGVIAQGAAAAQALIAQRPTDQLWGWKDPRTTLLLDFWAQYLPQARYLLVYRWPWDVADSILRINHPTFTGRPDYALRTWAFYNQHVLAFYRRHRSQCVLVNVNRLLLDPAAFAQVLTERLGLSLDPAAAATVGDRYQPELFGQLGWDHPLVGALWQVAPRYFDLLADLEQAADLPGLPETGTGVTMATLRAARLIAPSPVPATFAPSQEPELVSSASERPPEYYPLALHYQALSQLWQRQHLMEVWQQQQLALEQEAQQLRQQVDDLTRGASIRPAPNPRSRWGRLRGILKR